MTFLLLYWKWVLGGVLVLGVVAFGLWVQGLRTENLELTEKLAQSETQLKAYAQSQLINQAALTARSEAAEALVKEKDVIITNLRKIYENDKEACAWGNGRIPDSVYRQLCE